MPTRAPVPAAACAVLLFSAGCASLRTDKSHHAGVDALLAKGDYPAAIARIEAAKQNAYARKDRVAYYLDIGMLHHWNGDHETSNQFLERAERAIEENFTRSLARSASSLILNDNVLAYAGEDYEDVYLNAFKALNYLALGRTDEAFVEIRRIDLKLVQLNDKHARMARRLAEAEEAQAPFRPGRNPFQESALGRYLGALLYRNEGKWDDVRIDLEKVAGAWRLQPGIYAFPEPDLSRTAARVGPSAARLNVFAFSGLAPDKKASTFYLHTEDNLVVLAGSSENYLGKQGLDGVATLPWPGVNAGYHFKIQLPRMEKRPSKVARIEVVVDGAHETLQPIESLENTAIETFAIRKPLIYVKTLSRAIAKGLSTQQAKQKLTETMDAGFSFFTRIAADLLVDQTENADLRTSRYFPAAAAIGEIHLEAGAYDVAVNYYGADGALLRSDARSGVRLEAGRLNVLESAYLD